VVALTNPLFAAALIAVVALTLLHGDDWNLGWVPDGLVPGNDVREH
jgi:hypothetical protein